MKIVILGAGTVGFQLARILTEEEKDVVLVEKDPQVAKYVTNHLDCLVINDEGNNVEILKQAGIEDADFFISVTHSDEMNIVSCMIVASEYNVPCKIARIRNRAYFSKANRTSFPGIDHLVHPEIEAAQAIINTVEHGATSDVKGFEYSDIQIRNILVDKDSFFDNKQLWEIKQSLGEEFLIVGISRKHDFIIPKGDTMVRAPDILYLIARKNNLESIFAKAGRPKKKLRKIMVVGASEIGSYVANHLLKLKKEVTLVDRSYKKSKELAVDFPGALVIHANISDENVFREERLHENDLIITTTDNQELNILTAIYAKAIGIKRAVALVANNNYLQIANKLGLDATISPKISSVDAILRLIRVGNVKQVHSIFDGSTGIIELFIDDNSPVVNQAIKDIVLPPDTLIVSVRRDKKMSIPDGNFVIEKDDTVVVVAKKEALPAMEKIFNG